MVERTRRSQLKNLKLKYSLKLLNDAEREIWIDNIWNPDRSEDERNNFVPYCFSRQAFDTPERSAVSL